MLTYAAPKNLFQWTKLFALYYATFPAAERKRLSTILKMHRRGSVDVWCFMLDDHFAGFAITLNGDHHILIDYLVVPQKYRGQGIGAEILSKLRTHYGKRAIFLEIESAFDPGPDQPLRLRRRHFYEKCGMTSMDLFVWLFEVKMEILNFGCTMTYEEYVNFYRVYYGQWSTEHIRPAEK